MEKWLEPKHKTELIKWFLQTAAENNWIILFEYSEEVTSNLLRQSATEVSLPLQAEQHYEADCKLMAIKKPIVTDTFIKEVIRNTHVMSGHDGKEMLFLFADDYHEDCLSCSDNFYNQYKQLLCEKDLIVCYL